MDAYGLIGAAIVVMAIVWVFLPFAIFGTKDKLQELIDLLTETNKLLRLQLPDSERAEAVEEQKDKTIYY